MNFDQFKNEASSALWKSAADYFKASLPKPPGTSAPPPSEPTPSVIISALPAQVGGIDQKTILIAGGVIVGTLVLVVLLKKKGKK